MGADNERLEAGTAPVWLKGQGQAPAVGTEVTSAATRAGVGGWAGGAGGGLRPTCVPSRCFQAIEAHSSGINDVAFEKAGKLLATAGDDSYVKVWDPGSGRQQIVLKVTKVVRALHGFFVFARPAVAVRKVVS